MLNTASPMMECFRCQSLLIPTVLDRDDSGLRWVWGWRCVACGNVVDSIILRQRSAPQDAKRRTVPRRRTVPSQ